MAIYFNLVILVSWKVLLEAMSLNTAIVFSVFLEFFIWILFIILYNLLVSTPASVGWSGIDGILESAYLANGEFFQLARMPLFWLYSLLVLVVAITPEVLYKFVKKVFFAFTSDIVMRYAINAGIQKKSKSYRSDRKRQRDIEAGLVLHQKMLPPTIASVSSKA